MVKSKEAFKKAAMPRKDNKKLPAPVKYEPDVEIKHEEKVAEVFSGSTFSELPISDKLKQILAEN